MGDLVTLEKDGFVVRCEAGSEAEAQARDLGYAEPGRIFDVTCSPPIAGARQKRKGRKPRASRSVLAGRTTTEA